MSILTAGQAVADFLHRAGVKDSTRTANRKALQEFLAVVQPETPLAVVTATDIDALDYRLTHRAVPLSPYTVYKYLSSVRTLFNWLVKRELITPDANPIRHFSFHEPPRGADSKAIPADVLQAIITDIRAKPFEFMIRDEAMVRCLAAGLREMEVRKLELSRLDLDAGHANVWRKGGWVQKRHLGTTTCQALRAWLAIRPPNDTPYVFVKLRGDPAGPLAEGVVSQIVRRIAHKVAGQAYGSHSLRHWFGQWLADNGVNAQVVAKALGITVEVAMKHYFNQTDERVVKAVEAYELAEVAGHPTDHANIIPLPPARLG